MIIRIIGHDYRVVFKESDWKTESDSHGQCDTTAMRIKIVKGMPRSRTLETLVHEIGHAIYYEMGITHVEDKGEEAINGLFMSGWHQVLMDNPQLVNLYATE